VADPKVAPEVAESEFDRFVEAMDLEVNKEGMDAEDRQSFDNAKAIFLRAVMAGSLVVNDDGEPVFRPTTVEGAEPITFHEPEGANLMAMDTQKRTHDFGKIHHFLAGITRTNPKRFAQMKNRDLKVCHAIAGLFLGG